MKHEFNPASLDVVAFAKSAQSLSGQAALREFERLAEDASDVTQGDVRWSLQGQVRPGPGGVNADWLTLTAQASVPMTCQRCLKPVLLPLDVQRDFRFVADEQTAWAQDEEAQEDLLVSCHDLDALALVEDELIMAMPLVPMHEACEGEWAQTSEEKSEVVAEKPNPFAVLANLRIRKD
jgi:uncharacterized protein